MDLNRIKNLSISLNSSILDAMKMMDAMRVKMLLVFEKGDFVSIVTIGDIQRSIIKKVGLDKTLSTILQRDKKYAYVGDSEDSIKDKILRLRAECMPILSDNGALVDVVFWKDLFPTEVDTYRKPIDIPVVIMAGGKGTRLKPLTNVIPKPLIPIGDKTIIEEIMDQFEGIGCKKFFLSVNYKVDILKLYFSQITHQYDITYFQEDKPLGTIGSVALLKGKIHTPFIVSNCDIVIDQDYRDVYEYHVNNRNDITLVTAVKSNRIPYGVIETGEDGLMTGLSEKPETTFMFNTGVYILNSELIDEIPEGKVYHITDLMEKVKSRGGRVGCFPVSEHAWRDMGEWPEYLKMIKVL